MCMNGLKCGFGLMTTLMFICLLILPVSSSAIMEITDNSADSMTVIDNLGREVTINLPVEKIAIIDSLPQVASTIEAIGAYDKVIASDDRTLAEKIPSPKDSNVQSIGKSAEPDLEKLIVLNPDLVLVGQYATDEYIQKLEDTGLNVLSVSIFPTLDDGFKSTQENTLVLGKILGAETKAKEFVDWRGYYLDTINERVSNLSEDDLPLAMYTYKWDGSKIYGSGAGNRFHYILEFTGTEDANSDVPGDWAEVDLEHIIMDNPSYIIFEEMNYESGYGKTDTTTMSDSIESLKNLPGMDTIDAVKNNNIYGLPVSVMTGDTWLAAIYLAPVFHPDLFDDMNAEKIHQEYFDKFLGIDFNVATDGIFLYPKKN